MYLNKVIGLSSKFTPTGGSKVTPTGGSTFTPTGGSTFTPTGSSTSTTTTQSGGGGTSSGSEGEDKYRGNSTNAEYKPLPGDVYYIPPVVTKNQNPNLIIENIKPIAIGLIFAKILHII